METRQPNAVDADYTTMWSSASSDNQWIYVDLGSAFQSHRSLSELGAKLWADYILQVSLMRLTGRDLHQQRQALAN